MGHYVYRYMHPDYPWLYVGKTDVSLESRINSHSLNLNDNISREFLPLLSEASVYYIELENSLQTTYIEKLLIDKYKPFLNKADKIEESTCPIEIGSIKWKKFETEQKPKVIIQDRPCEKVVERIITVEKPVYKELTKKQQKEFAKFSYISSKYYAIKSEFNSIKSNGVVSSGYAMDIHGEMFKPNAKDFINYYKNKKPFSSDGLWFWSFGYDCFGNQLRFEFDDGRASIGFLRDGKYWTDLKSAYVDAEGFKEIIHIANVFGGVYGASKRDYELFLKYFEASKEKNKSDYYDDRIRLVKNTISIIENNSFYIPEWVSRPEY